jgi:hypothetical protein
MVMSRAQTAQKTLLQQHYDIKCMNIINEGNVISRLAWSSMDQKES